MKHLARLSLSGEFCACEGFEQNSGIKEVLLNRVVSQSLENAQK